MGHPTSPTGTSKFAAVLAAAAVMSPYLGVPLLVLAAAAPARVVVAAVPIPAGVVAAAAMGAGAAAACSSLFKILAIAPLVAVSLATALYG